MMDIPWNNLIGFAIFVAIWLLLRWRKKLRKELGLPKGWKWDGKEFSRKMRQRSLDNHRRNTKKQKKQKKQMKEARELAKETYKKARSSKDDKEYSHPTEHDESDDLEMVKAIKEKE